MFPRHKGFYFPLPGRFKNLNQSNNPDWIYWNPVHDNETSKILSAHVSLSIATLKQSYRHFCTDLLGLLPDLLATHDLKVKPFPQLKLPLVGTLVHKSPVATVKKLVNIKQDYPTLAALSYSLPGDIITGNNVALFKKIDSLQDANYSLFSEFYYFLTSNWDLFLRNDWSSVSTDFFKQFYLDCANRSSLMDSSGYFDCKKFERAFQNQNFLYECIVKLIDGSHSQQLYPIYGLGLRLILEGRIDVLKYILNDKLHPFDALFLKIVLPSMLRICFIASYHEEFRNDKLDSSISYFAGFAEALNKLDDSNFKNVPEFNILSLHYTLFAESYSFSIIVKGLTTTPRLGERCLVHVFPLEVIETKPKQKMRFDFPTTYDNYDSHVLDHMNTFNFIAHNFKLVDNDSSQGMFENQMLGTLLVYMMNLLIQAPVAKLVKHPILGAVIRAIIPGFRLDLLTLPLCDAERALAVQLLHTPGQTPLYSSLQTFHLAQLMDSPTIVRDGVHLFIEGFINLSKKAVAKGRAFYCGSHDEYTLNRLHQNVKSGPAAQHAEIKSVAKLWQRTFGFFEIPHPQYELIEGAPYSRAKTFYGDHEFLLTPNTPSVKHRESGQRFYPIAFGPGQHGKGLYCHLEEGARLPEIVDQNTQYIASGCCLLGSDFVATVESPEGRFTYHPLDAHQVVPAGTIIDFSYKHQEHPEEAMYLAIQKTLAPFYRDTHRGKQVVFYYHDLRNNYLFYLLPHYIKGTLSRELLLKAMALFDARHQLMMSKLTTIFTAQDIECRAFSSFNALGRDSLLQEIERKREGHTSDEIENALSLFVLNTLSNDAAAPAETRRVYSFIQSQKARYHDLLRQQGLRSLAIVDYMAQFAIINQWAKAPVLVALSCVEYKLLSNYELLFAQAFGSVMHFLWLNPITLRDDQKYNRLFFIDQNIEGYRQLIEVTAEPLQELIKQQALDDPFGVMRVVDEIKLRISLLPHFFAEPKSLPISRAVSSQAIDTTTEQHTVLERVG